MSVFARSEIEALIERGDLTITPFDSTKLEPASYDCKLGDIIAAGIGKVDLEEGADFVLESNTWAAVSTLEIFKFPNNVCATYGIRSGLARRGLICFGGPQIDPGYHGRIFISVYNPTLEPITLRKGGDFFSVIFYQLTSEDQRGYCGEHQNQKDFPSADVEMMMRMRTKNLSNVIDTVETLDTSVRILSDNLKSLTTDVHEIKKVVADAKPYIKAIGFILGAAAIATIGFVVVELLSKVLG